MTLCIPTGGAGEGEGWPEGSVPRDGDGVVGTAEMRARDDAPDSEENQTLLPLPGSACKKLLTHKCLACKGSHRSHLGTERRHGHLLPASHPAPDSLYNLLMKRSSGLTSDTFLLLKKCTFMIAKLKDRVFKKKKSDYSKLTI